MVRAGVVAHPREWREAGYGEIQRPPARYRIIDRVALCELLGVAEQRLAVVQNEWIDSQLVRGTPERDLRWSHAVAVGRRSMGATWRPLSTCATVPHMDSIGVRQLQQNAATTVERVRLGESIEVTVRGRPVAKLVPVGGTLLDQLEASGKLTRGKGDLLDLGPPLKPRRGVELPSVTLAKMRARER